MTEIRSFFGDLETAISSVISTSHVLFFGERENYRRGITITIQMGIGAV